MKLLNKLLKSKVGYSVGFTWVFGLVTIFGLGVLYIIFSQVFGAHLVPVITNYVNNVSTIDNATKVEIIANITKYMDLWNIIPFVLILVVIIYMIIAAIRKEGETSGY